MSILSVIPARGGSKGIPRKNLRRLAGVPLVSRAIRKSLGCALIDCTVVSTDDEEIAELAVREGARVIMRPPELADDAATLDPVVYDAAVRIERELDTVFNAVVTLQPTSPLLRADTIARVLERFIERVELDTLIAAVDDTHLAWQSVDGVITPTYRVRVCRQWLDKTYRETGGILCTRRRCLIPDSRVGEVVDLFEIPLEESLDIDGPFDWMTAEAALGTPTLAIVFGTLESVAPRSTWTWGLLERLAGHSPDLMAMPGALTLRRYLERYHYRVADYDIERVASGQTVVLEQGPGSWMPIDDLLDKGCRVALLIADDQPSGVSAKTRVQLLSGDVDERLEIAAPMSSRSASAAGEIPEDSLVKLILDPGSWYCAQALLT